MASYNEGPTKTFRAGEAMTVASHQYAAVKIKAGSTTVPPEVELTDGTAGADTAFVGFAVLDENKSSGDPLLVVMANCVASCKCIVSDTGVAVDDVLFTGASGKLTTTTTSGSAVGIAISASDTDGDVLEVCPMPQTVDAVDAT